MRHLIAIGALAVTGCASATPTPLLSLGDMTPTGACGDVSDCAFRRGFAEYVSFEGSISRRTVCVPAPILLSGIRRGDDLMAARARLTANQEWAHVVAKTVDGIVILSAASRSQTDMALVEVSFTRSGRVRCVSELAPTV